MAETYDKFSLRFGPYKHVEFKDVPASYLAGLLQEDWLSANLRNMLTTHLQTTRKGEWETLWDGKPNDPSQRQQRH